MTLPILYFILFYFRLLSFQFLGSTYSLFFFVCFDSKKNTQEKKGVYSITLVWYFPKRYNNSNFDNQIKSYGCLKLDRQIWGLFPLVVFTFLILCLCMLFGPQILRVSGIFEGSKERVVRSLESKSQRKVKCKHK